MFVVKAKNPKISVEVEEARAEVKAFLDTNCQDKDLTFDEIRAVLNSELSDGVIHQIALDAGFEVEID